MTALFFFSIIVVVVHIALCDNIKTTYTTNNKRVQLTTTTTTTTISIQEQLSNTTSVVVDITTESFLLPHNMVRMNVFPVASPLLPDMTMSSLMTSYASTFTQACVYKHGGPNFGTYGQNVFASVGGIPTASGIVTAWASESRFYNYDTHTCDVGRVCTHYTQVVWRKSVEVGCAVQKCFVNSPFSTTAPWYFAVCNYKPHGNYVGERPY